MRESEKRRELIVKFLREYGVCTTRFLLNKVGFVMKGTEERQIASDLRLMSKAKRVRMRKITDVSIERHTPFNRTSRHAQKITVAEVRDV